MNNDIVLTGSTRSDNPLKFCDKCEKKQQPEGGVSLGNGRWYCTTCWRRKTNVTPKGGRK